MGTAASIRPRHFRWEHADRVATITLDRPERKNPLTLESYRELTDTFVALQTTDDVKAVVLTGAGKPFDGKYAVTASRHVFEPDTGYRTWLTVSGGQAFARTCRQ